MWLPDVLTAFWPANSAVPWGFVIFSLVVLLISHLGRFRP